MKVKDTDKGWNFIFENRKLLKEIKEKKVKVGVLQDTPKGGAEHGDSGLTVAEIATILEFGTEDGHIPARPALQITFDKNRDKLVELGQKLIGGVFDRKITVDKALNVMGAALANEVKKEITTGEGIPPDNAESTIRKKGSDRPWVDTSRVLNSITWMVDKKKEQ